MLAQTMRCVTNLAIQMKPLKPSARLIPRFVHTQPVNTDLFEERSRGINDLRERLRRKGFAAVDSTMVREWLNAELAPKGLDAAELMPNLQRLWTECPQQRSSDGEVIYKHKKVFHSRYQLPQGMNSGTAGLIRETFDIVTDNDGTRRQRYDAHVTTSTDGTATQHYTRYYPALPDKWNDDMLLQAIHHLFVEVVAKPRQLEMGIQAPAGSIMYQF